MRKLNVLLISLLVVLSFAGFAAAQTPEGAGTSVTDANQTANTGGAEDATIQAGTVTNLSIDSDQITEKWAGFYGTISGQIILGDGNDNFYEWTTSSFGDALVAAVPKGQPAPSSISAVGTPDSFLGSEYNSGSDSAANTFSQTGDVTLAESTATDTSYAMTLNNAGSDTFETYLVQNGDSTGSDDERAVYIADGKDGETGFDGNSVDYQMLVGVGDSADEQAFTFYMELK